MITPTNGPGPWYAGMLRQLVGQGIGAVLAVLVLCGVYLLISRQIIPLLVMQGGAIVTAVEAIKEAEKTQTDTLTAMRAENLQRAEDARRATDSRTREHDEIRSICERCRR